MVIIVVAQLSGCERLKPLSFVFIIVREGGRGGLFAYTKQRVVRKLKDKKIDTVDVTL